MREIMLPLQLRGQVMGEQERLGRAPADESGDVEEAEVSLQVIVPAHVKHALDLHAVQTGRTRRALVLEALRSLGIEVTDRDIAGRRGVKKA